MRRNWIALAAAVALLAVASHAGAQAADGAKPAAAPPKSAAPQEPTNQGRAPVKKISTPSNKKLVNLNTASKAELKSLPGGSDEEAARIIAGRPYNSKAFLVTNKVISDGRYFEIKKLVVAGELPKPAAPKK